VAIEFPVGRIAATLCSLALLAGCSTSTAGSPSAPDQDTGSSAESDSGSDSGSNSGSGGGSGGAAEEFTPSEDNQDPSQDIEGVVVTTYEPLHTEPGQRVAYTKAPPDGGRHDPVWADCNGALYEEPVRNEHMVHALEHGAVWIAYDPEQLSGGELGPLVDRVENTPYMMLSPYPGLEEPISLQSWGHQLRLTDPDDERIDQFIAALRTNQYTSPEPGARCDSDGTGFDLAAPPPLETTPPGPDAAPVDGP
jgi:hypothetical protein